ncbi:MAG: hypothetical protein INF89_18375 [Roseomonas sp.]|nr:hypothetical protein [Roseomonas sp.]
MPQHDLILDNGSGAAFRADANNALAALGSTMKGPNAPPAPIAGLMWLDDDTPSASLWTLKMYDGADWIEIGRLNVTTNVFTVAEGSFAPVDIASAATTDIGAAASPNVRITGTTTITSFGTVAAGTRRFLAFAAALTLTHNATSLILPGAANITTAAGDTAVARSLGSGNWVIESYSPVGGSARAGAAAASGLTMATARLLGRTTAGAGAFEEISTGGGLVLASGVLTGASMPQTASGVGQVVFINPGYATNYTLPSGGTWLVFRFQIGVAGDYRFVHGFDIQAGGTSLGTPGANITWIGWAWRIA